MVPHNTITYCASSKFLNVRMYSALPLLLQILPYVPQASVISSSGEHNDLDQIIHGGGDEHWHMGTLSKQHERCLWQQVGDTI